MLYRLTPFPCFNPLKKWKSQFFIEEHFKSLIPNRDMRDTLISLLTAFLNIETISLRQIQQALNRFQLVLVFTQDVHAKFLTSSAIMQQFCVALILYLHDPDMLRQFIRGELSDKDLVESTLPSTIKGNKDLFDQRLWFELIVIRVAQEIAGKNPSTGKYYDTPLLQLYSNKLAQSTSDSSDPRSEEYFAKNFMEKFQDQTGILNYNWYHENIYRRFIFAVKQLEMIEPLTN